MCVLCVDYENTETLDNTHHKGEYYGLPGNVYEWIK